MGIIQMKCANCGGSLDIDQNVSRGVCKYCNTPFVVPKSTTGVDVSALFEMANTALEAKNYEEAIEKFNDILAQDMNNGEALLGKAFASLGEFKLNKLNFEEFELYFNKAVENNTKDTLSFHTEILSKTWTMMVYMLQTSSGVFANTGSERTFVENLIAMYFVQKAVANVIDNAELNEISQEYKDNYKEFKTASAAHGDYLITASKRYCVKLSKDFIKDVKVFTKTASKQLKEFNKKHR